MQDLFDVSEHLEKKDGKEPVQEPHEDEHVEEELMSTKDEISGQVDKVLAPSKEEQMAKLIEKFSSVGRFARWAKDKYRQLSGVSSEALESLGQYSFVLIDDDLHNHVTFVPGLIAHGREATGILYRGNISLEEILEQLQEFHPDFVLVDNDLRRNMSGPQIVGALNGLLPETQFIGFSDNRSPTNLKKQFREAGAIGYVEKRNLGIDDVQMTIESLAEFIVRLKKKE
ncbi:hypothetical protein KC725_01495 [Candidatus Peregrinibacteria bacterium]|nr:hypothetical protein [Candidatus Peregrinibacteria bacterium]